MKNILKAIRNMIDGVYHYVDEMVRKATESKPDWNQNDPTAPDYVKNRTHYAEVKPAVIIENQTIDVSDCYATFEGSKATPLEGKTYVVTLNGTRYKCVAWWYADWEAIILGKGSLVTSDCEGFGEDVPFAIELYDGYSEVYMYLSADCDDGEYTVSVEGDAEIVHKIAEKYLPAHTNLVDENNNVLQRIFVPKYEHITTWGVYNSNNQLRACYPEYLNNVYPTYLLNIRDLELPSEVGQTTSSTTLQDWGRPKANWWYYMFVYSRTSKDNEIYISTQHTMKNGFVCAQGILVGDENQIYCIKAEQTGAIQIYNMSPTQYTITRIL